jgi:hypothetical protein
MIEKQLHLIERRRLELMQSRNLGPANQQKSSNLNSITNQQWDILNEYASTTTATSSTTSSSSCATVAAQQTNNNSKASKAKTKASKKSKSASTTLKKKTAYVDQSNMLHLEISSENSSSHENDITTSNAAVSKKNLGKFVFLR